MTPPAPRVARPLHSPRAAPTFMVIAGEPSGDLLAAELVLALSRHPRLAAAPFPPRFFAAGGPHLQAAGAELWVDLTRHAVFGLGEVLRQYPRFKRLFARLLDAAFQHQPDVIILVDYAGFNRLFAAAVRRLLARQARTFANWKPVLVYFVSPQVWASRESRVHTLERDVDLLLSIFPFEKQWYAQKAPRLRVEFVGHPLLDRHSGRRPDPATTPGTGAPASTVVLLPGSRPQEIRRHLPLLAQAVDHIRRRMPVEVRTVLPNEHLAGIAREAQPPDARLGLQTGDLSSALAGASLALACSGTVTLECAFHRVPAVVVYRLSWLTHQIAQRIVKVPFIAMPNLIAGERIYPELIQARATPEAIAAEALQILADPARRADIVRRLDAVIDALGEPGACARAADAIVGLAFS